MTSNPPLPVLTNALYVAVVEAVGKASAPEASSPATALGRDRHSTTCRRLALRGLVTVGYSAGEVAEAAALAPSTVWSARRAWTPQLEAVDSVAEQAIRDVLAMWAPVAPSKDLVLAQRLADLVARRDALNAEIGALQAQILPI